MYYPYNNILGHNIHLQVAIKGEFHVDHLSTRF